MWGRLAVCCPGLVGSVWLVDGKNKNVAAIP
jgi:hypothetical protein